MKQFLRILSTFLVAFVLAAIATGCGEDYSPTAPPTVPPTTSGPPDPPAFQKGDILGLVRSADQWCLTGASVEIMDGARAGERVEQTAVACAEVMDGHFYAFVLRDLPLDQPVTLRASMPGFEPVTRVCRVSEVSDGYWYYDAENFTLAPVR